ncbi:MAG TPA: 50S ribosomal protein L11 methyltransferase [Verrucomicrobiae bacterium]|nr:50S ribosomal protein L11 methyltransferase [Verrucomicrobiae bacterium]
MPVPLGEETVAELLADWFGQPACSYTDLARGRTTVCVYLQSRPDWSTAARGALSKALKQIHPKELSAPSLTKLRREDWAESWKKHFKPITIGGRLLILPSWSHKRPRAGQLTVVLDPGMSFGTGQHPTTSFCLAELVRNRRPGQPQSFLDVGTGSGILAVCAAKLGYEPIRALDLDSTAVANARDNARANGVADKITFQRRDLASLPAAGSKKYSVVCANLLADLLLLHRDRLAALVQGGGTLAVAGVLKTEFEVVLEAYQGAGLRLLRSGSRGEWRSGSFRK